MGKGRKENLQNAFHYPFLLLVFLFYIHQLFIVSLFHSWMFTLSSFLIILYFNPILCFSVYFTVCSFLLLLYVLCCSFPHLPFPLVIFPVLHPHPSSFVLSLQCLSPIHLSLFFVIIVLTFLSHLLLCIPYWYFQKRKYYFMLVRGVPFSSIHDKLLQV